jgi:hypothetical protein
MQTCNNCKAGLSCGCQRRVASNGTNVCTNCIAKYEAALVAARNKQNLNNALAPTVNEVKILR